MTTLAKTREQVKQIGTVRSQEQQNGFGREWRWGRRCWCRPAAPGGGGGGWRPRALQAERSSRRAGRCRPAAPRGGGGGRLTAVMWERWRGGVGGRRGAARIRGGGGAERRCGSDDLGIEKGLRRGRRLGKAPLDSIGGVQQSRTPRMRYYPRRTTHLYASDTDMWSRPLNGVRAPPVSICGVQITCTPRLSLHPGRTRVL
jgi:hypothetical protein